MDALIYITWVSIPIVLVLLAVLVALRNSFDDSKEIDRSRPRRILRRANAFAFYAAFCAALDLYVLRDIGEWSAQWKPSEELVLLIRLCLLPLVALIGGFTALVYRSWRPRRGFDRLQVEVRGSSPVFLFIAFAVVALIIWERGDALRVNPFIAIDLSGSQGANDSNTTRRSFYSDNSGGGDSPPDAPAELPPLLVSLVRGIESAAATLQDLLGISATPSTSPAPTPRPARPEGDRPDFNPEGNLAFGPVAESIAREVGVDPILVRALIEASSGFNVRWEGMNGHRGLMGLRPDVMQAIGNRDFFNGHQNIRFGCAELKRIVALSGNDLRLTIVRYRVGPQAALKDITPGSFLEEFVDKVINIYEIAKARESTDR